MAVLDKQLMGKPGRMVKPVEYKIPCARTALRVLCTHLAKGQCDISRKKCKGEVKPHKDQISAVELEKLGWSKTTGYCMVCSRTVNITLMKKVEQPDKLNTGKLGKRASRA